MFNKLKHILKRLRIFILLKFKYQFISTGKNFYCGKNLSIRPNTVTVGNDVFIGNNANLAVHKLFIDDYVMFGPNVSVVGGDHRFDIVGTPCRNTGRDIEKDVYVGKDVWVGFGTIIMQGTKIGEGSIIAAGSLVTKDIPPYTIYGGHPAIFIKNRFKDQNNEIVHSKKIKGIYF